MKNRLAKLGALAVGLGVLAGSALATDPTPADMGAITLPVSTTSIVTAIFTVGGVALAAVLALVIGFRIMKRLASKAGSAV